MKVCSRCKQDLPDENFRTRVDKRPVKECVFLNNTCKKCDAEIAHEYHQRKKNDPEYKNKNCKRAKECRIKEGKKYYEKLKVRRQSERYKTAMRNYRNKNKTKIQEQEKVTKDRYYKK